MVFKKLHELTANELRIELRRAGIKEKYIKAEAIMRLTTHLIDVSEDPVFFDPEMPFGTDMLMETITRSSQILRRLGQVQILLLVEVQYLSLV